MYIESGLAPRYPVIGTEKPVTDQDWGRGSHVNVCSLYETLDLMYGL